ncbi:hypothetical protein NCS56_01032500 [Fusarium sp. Ph1]|nr:hypothetical protein NCS56_01032500 [Fusarium sp. Ph1]
MERLEPENIIHQLENGRTYHSMSAGKYAYPNDKSENERLEIQHNVWLLTLQGSLALCPFGEKGAKRVLDLGTGTGCWAIEYADAFPGSEVQTAASLVDVWLIFGTSDWRGSQPDTAESGPRQLLLRN